MPRRATAAERHDMRLISDVRSECDLALHAHAICGVARRWGECGPATMRLGKQLQYLDATEHETQRTAGTGQTEDDARGLQQECRYAWGEERTQDVLQDGALPRLDSGRR